MNVKKNPFGEKTPSQRLMLQGGTPYDIENEKPKTSNSGMLFSRYNPVLITPSTLDELVSVRGELNFLLIYNLIEKWSQSDNPRTWKPSAGVAAVKEELQITNSELYRKELEGKHPNLYFSAWFEDNLDNEPDFIITNPPKQSLVINCSSIPTPPPDADEERKKLAALSQRLPLGHIMQLEDNRNIRSEVYNWLYSNFLIRDFAGVRPSPEQYNLIDSTKYKMGAASMLTNGLPGVGKSTDLQIAAIELILQPGPNRENRKLLYFTHDNTQKRIAQQEIKSILRVAYCAPREVVKTVEDSITFVSRKQMFGSIFPAQTPELDISNWDGFLEEIGISYSSSKQEQEFYQYAGENFLKIVLGWFGSIQKFREFTKQQTFEEAMNSPIQLFHIHENHGKDGLPTMKIGDHWKGYDTKSSRNRWSKEDWTKFNRLLNKITDSKKLRSYENEKGEYWTYSINCEIVDEAYRRLASSGTKSTDAVDRWSGKLIELQDDPGEDQEEDYEEDKHEGDKPIWIWGNKNKFDAIIIDEVQNFSPISLSVILKHQSNRTLGRERWSREEFVSPFLLKASGDAFQSMTNNTFFENNRHMIDIFRGWGRFVRDEGSNTKSGTGVSKIQDEYLSINHRNSEPIVSALNLLYRRMFAEQRRTGKITKEIEPKPGAEEGAIIDLKIKQSGNNIQNDILSVVVQSLVDQIEQRNTDDDDVTSRNTFLIIPDKEFTDVDETKDSIIDHIEYLISFLPGDNSRKIEIIRKQLDVLAGEGYAKGNIDEFRYLLLCRGIASVKDVQGLTVEAAIVSGLRKKGRTELRHLQEAFVAFSRPRKILILSDKEDVDLDWIKKFPVESRITISPQKVEDYIRSKKGTDFNWFLRKTLKYPYSRIRWNYTKSAIDYAKGGYSGILRGEEIIETPQKNNYDNLEKIIEKMENLFTNYSNGKLIETWDNIIHLEESTRGASEKLPKELRDLEDLFSQQSFFKLKLFIALQFLHRYAADQELWKIAPLWIKKLEEGGENSFFSKVTKMRKTEHLLYVFFHSSLKLIHHNLSKDEKDAQLVELEEAKKYLLPLGRQRVASLTNPTLGKGRSAQTNLERTIFVGHNQDSLWNFPPDPQKEDFHYMPVEGEWSLRPKQIYDTFRILIEKLNASGYPTEFHNELCESAALAYINDNDRTIIELIKTNPIEPKKAYDAIKQLLSSPEQHPELFSYLVEEYHEKVATKLIELPNKRLQDDLQKYRIALNSSAHNWRAIYNKLIRNVDEKRYRPPEVPWFIRETPNDFHDVIYRPEYNNISVSYSFDLNDQLIKDRSNSFEKYVMQKDPTSEYIEKLTKHHEEIYSENKRIFGENLPTYTDSIVELMDIDFQDDIDGLTIGDVKYLRYIIPKIIEDEGLETLDYVLGNNTKQDECVSNLEFLWRLNSTPERLKKTVKLCVFLLDQKHVSKKLRNKAEKFLGRTIIAISLYYIQNHAPQTWEAHDERIDWENLCDIWKIITDNRSIDDLFTGRPFVIDENDRKFGKTNEGEPDDLIFKDIEEYIGFHNWNSLDMSLSDTGKKLQNKINRSNRDFEFGKLLGKKGVIWLQGEEWTKSNKFVNFSKDSPKFRTRKRNDYWLGRLPNRPHRDSNTKLVRYQYLNKYSFKLIDEIIRGESKLEKENYIFSGLIEEWIFQQLNDKNFDKKEIIELIIQTMQASRKDNYSISDSYENLDGLGMTKVSDANKVVFSFKISPKFNTTVIDKRNQKQKSDDEILYVKEKLAEIMAYLPYLAAREDKKLVHSQIIIENNPNIKWENLGNEYYEEINPGKAGHRHVFTLIPLNKEDEGLPIMRWYKANFSLIRRFVENDENQFMPPRQERHHSLFRYNTLPIESPSVHIAALLDAGKEPTEIKKQLLEYYPSLGLLRTSDPPSKDECSKCGREMDPEWERCPYCKTGDK